LIDVYLIAYFVSNNIPGRIEAAACPNQDPLKATTGLVPLLGIDVW
jgi:Fe-Mn family superoxide dismutase